MLTRYLSTVFSLWRQFFHCGDTALSQFFRCGDIVLSLWRHSSFTPNLKLQEVRFWSVRRIGQIFVAMGLSIKYVTLFLANFDPLPPLWHTLSHISGPPRKYVTHL